MRMIMERSSASSSTVDSCAFAMDSELRREAVIFTRYLVQTDPSETLIARYCEANRELFAGETPSDDDAAVLDLARRHPWTIAGLDARAGLLRPASLLRKKLLVMLAIVETTPDLAPRTEPRAASLGVLALRLGRAGASAAVNVVAGVVLSAVIARRRRAR